MDMLKYFFYMQETSVREANFFPSNDQIALNYINEKLRNRKLPLILIENELTFSFSFFHLSRFLDETSIIVSKTLLNVEGCLIRTN